MKKHKRIRSYESVRIRVMRVHDLVPRTKIEWVKDRGHAHYACNHLNPSAWLPILKWKKLLFYVCINHERKIIEENRAISQIYKLEFIKNKLQMIQKRTYKTPHTSIHRNSHSSNKIATSEAQTRLWIQIKTSPISEDR